MSIDYDTTFARACTDRVFLDAFSGKRHGADNLALITRLVARAVHWFGEDFQAVDRCVRESACWDGKWANGRWERLGREIYERCRFSPTTPTGRSQ